ncbi:MAG TPA: hypothetical protein VE079_12165 [Ensifer sp.]|nr:hypothetical protein [Ensifer sp.]
MTADLFNYWKDVQPHERFHPEDKPVLDRISHGFDLNCLPANFDGPLKTAPVVLLYLSPGWNQRDVDEANDQQVQQRYFERRLGHRALTSENENVLHFRWRQSRTKLFGDCSDIREKIAVLNICAYHSKSFKTAAALTALPSCRVALDWAQGVLFTEAEAGRRIVICLRSAEHWGLAPGTKYGEALYAPTVNRSGHMANNPLRTEIINKARDAIANLDTVSF